MGIFKEWEERVEQNMTEAEYQSFWKEYLLAEQKNYEKILGSKNYKLTGTIKELAESFNMDAPKFSGFIDGINTSLTELIDLESLTEETQIDATIDVRKLYYNMLDAGAEWLYNLKEWDDILTLDERKEIKKAYNATKTAVKEDKPNRNEPCPCGSGKKYKKCCMNKE